MYYEIQPCKTNYDSTFKKVYLTFDEYIDSKVEFYGFSYLLDRILSDYKTKLRSGMKFEDYYTISVQLTQKFRPFNKKWEYFVKHNIQLHNGVKVDDEIEFQGFDSIHKLKVCDINFNMGYIRGNLIANDQYNGLSYNVSIGNIKLVNGSPKKIEYQIRRKKKVYNGSNSR